MQQLKGIITSLTTIKTERQCTPSWYLHSIIEVIESHCLEDEFHGALYVGNTVEAKLMEEFIEGRSELLLMWHQRVNSIQDLIFIGISKNLKIIKYQFS